MTIKEKVTAYDEALKVANKYKDTHIMFPSIKDEMFPELKESEDERIRKALLEMVHDTTGDSLWVDYNVHKEDAIAWLEKQGEQKPAIEMKTPEESLGIDSDTYNKIVDECIYGEQKPAAWSEEDKRCLTNAIYACKQMSDEDYDGSQSYIDAIKWLKSLKDRVQPKQEWSEEDSYMLGQAIKCVNNSGKLDVSTEEIEYWLESLRPQKQWKPTKEQMDALLFVVQHYTPKVTDKLAWDSIKILELMYHEIKQ